MKQHLRKSGNCYMPACSEAKRYFDKLADGDVIRGDLTKPRSITFNNGVHKVMEFLIEHMEQFESYDEHNLLKRMQVESDTECEHIYIHVDGVGMILTIQARSFSFDNMGQERYAKAVDKIVAHVQRKYWPDFSLDLLKSREAA